MLTLGSDNLFVCHSYVFVFSSTAINLSLEGFNGVSDYAI